MWVMFCGAVQELHQRGLQANKAGDARGALAYFLEAVALQPDRV